MGRQTREIKFNLNLETDQENIIQTLDENSIVALESKSKDFNETPGKELFRLNRCHKKKSQVWSAKSLPLKRTFSGKSVSNTPCKKSVPTKTPLKSVQTTSKSERCLRSRVIENAEITPRNTRKMSEILANEKVQDSGKRTTRNTSKILAKESTPRTSGNIRKILAKEKVVLDSEEEEPKETASSRKKRVSSARSKTPMVERCQKRIKANRDLAKVLESSESSDEESENEEEADLPSFGNYFKDSKDLSKKNTSNNNLSQLPVLDPQEYLKELKKICRKTLDLVNEQKARIQQFFPDWVFELEYGFNILCYGYGSKKDVLEEFVQDNFKGYPILKVNGFFPTLNFRSILSPLLELIGHIGSVGSVMDQVGLITSYFNSPNREIKCLILLIHNIDSVSLRNDKASTLLSLLAECPCIYMIASVDHINAPLLWDHSKSKRFNWVWHDTTSFSPWISESTFENSVLVKSGGIGPRNVIYVLNSLNAHARGIFGILAKHQIASQTIGSGISWNLLFQSSCEQFLVTNEITFSSLMTEFIDHKIVVKGSDESLEIPLDINSLVSIVEELEL